MKLITHYNAWAFVLFCFVFFILLLQCEIAKPASGDLIKPEGNRAGCGNKGDKEVVMTDKDKLTDKQGGHLLTIARSTIAQELFNKKIPEESYDDLPEIFRKQRGTFVTLTISDNLRGCIGHIIPQESLFEGIQINAINAAFRDPRFQPLTKKEWKKTKIEISILTDPKPISYIGADDLLAKLRPGIDGVIIKKGVSQATFLPQVWEQLPEKEDFLGHLCLKAGLSQDEWKKGDLKVLSYQVQAFKE